MRSMLIGIACEDNGHFSVAFHLIDAALVSQHTWIGSHIDRYRSWRGLTDDRPWYKYNPDATSAAQQSPVGRTTPAPSGDRPYRQKRHAPRDYAARDRAHDDRRTRTERC